MHETHRPGWQQLSTAKLLDHPRVPLVEDTVTLPDNSESHYARLLLPDAVTVLIEHDGKILFNLEYAYPVDDRIHRPEDITSDGWLFKCPGGMLNPGESFKDAAIREVGEETGVKVGGVTLLAAVRNYFPRSNSIDYKVLANVDGEMPIHRDAGEANMEQHWLTAEEVDQLIADRDPRVLHSHFLDIWCLYKNR